MNSIQDLREAIRESHGAGSFHVSSVPVRHELRDGGMWEGVVEVFLLTNHPKAKTAYAWTESTGDSGRHITVLHIPPVDSPLTAVRSAYDT